MESFVRGHIEEVVKEGTLTVIGAPQPYQVVKVRLLDGARKGEVVEVEHGMLTGLRDEQKVHTGQKVVLTEAEIATEKQFYITDSYRLPVLGWLALLFLGLAVLFGRTKGLTSILGLAVSVLVLMKFVVPNILAGYSPVLVVLAGAVLIAVVSLYVAHGFHRRTTVALAATLVTLVLATGLSVLFVSLARLMGAGTEEALFLKIGALEHINLQGLLLGGVIIGVLGVLDDTTTVQVAVVDELRAANGSLTRKELIRRALSVGREHIASLVNTLVLAYVGVSFPLFLLFTLNTETPLWVTLNSDLVAEEIVRTLVGSIALILAVPISTVLAAFFLKDEPSLHEGHGHHHG